MSGVTCLRTVIELQPTSSQQKMSFELANLSDCNSPGRSAAARVLDNDSFHLIERDLVARPVVELRRPRRFVRRDMLGVLDRPPVLQISRYPRRAERVAARGGGESGFERPALYHPQHVRARHGIRRELPLLVDAPKERRFLFVPDARSFEIRIEVCLGIVVRRHLMALAAFLMQPDPPALAVLVVVLDAHVDHGRDAREGVDTSTPMIARSRRPTMESVLIESRSVRAWSAFKTGVLPRLTTCFGPRTEDAGFMGTIWPVTRKSKSIRIAAKCCFTVGAAAGWCSMYAAITTGLICSSVCTRCFSHQAKNCATAWAYAARVFRFRIVAAKNSTKRHAAASPARPITAGRFSIPARARSRSGIGASSEVMAGLISYWGDACQTPQDQ